MLDGQTTQSPNHNNPPYFAAIEEAAKRRISGGSKARHEPLKTLASYRADVDQRYVIATKNLSPTDPEFGEIHIDKICVMGSLEDRVECTLWAYLIRSTGELARVDRLYQAARSVSGKLADALATLRGWDPGIIGDPDPGPVLVLDSMDTPPISGVLARGTMAALSQGLIDHPERLSADRLIVSIRPPSVFTQELMSAEVSRLIDRMAVKPSAVVPWKPADVDCYALVE